MGVDGGEEVAPRTPSPEAKPPPRHTVHSFESFAFTPPTVQSFADFFAAAPTTAPAQGEGGGLDFIGDRGGSGGGSYSGSRSGRSEDGSRGSSRASSGSFGTGVPQGPSQPPGFEVNRDRNGRFTLYDEKVHLNGKMSFDSKKPEVWLQDVRDYVAIDAR